MLIIGLIFLLPTAILASNYDNYGSYQNPMGYNDGHNRDFEVKPGNLIFNFEQLRRDQPPQIEMRDESPGLYMHKRPQTTTTVAPIIIPDTKHVPEYKVYENNNQFSRSSALPPRVNNDREMTPVHGTNNPSLTQTTVMASPPPPPKWSDFSETFNRQALPHYESQKPFEQTMPAGPQLNYFQRPNDKPSGPVETPFEHRRPELNNIQRSQHQTTAPFDRADLVNRGYRSNFVAPAHPYSSTTPENKPHDFVSMRKDMESSRQNLANRGSHKFGWNDMVTEPSWNHNTQQMSSTLTPAIQDKNPPPLPTLTPWLDGF